MLKIILISNILDCDNLCEDIINFSPSVIGLDTESKNNYCTLIQLCIPGNSSSNNNNYLLYKDLIIPTETLNYAKDNVYTIYLIRVSEIYKETNFFPKKLSYILRSKSIIKVGCDIDLDSKILKKSYGVSIQGKVDNQSLANSLGISKISMNSLSHLLFNLTKYDQVKGNYNIDWSLQLSEEMIKYSAYDSYLSYIIYYKLINKQFNHDLNKEKDQVIEDELLDPLNEDLIDEEGIISQMSGEDKSCALYIYSTTIKVAISNSKIPIKLNSIVTIIMNNEKFFASKYNKVELNEVLYNYIIYLKSINLINFDIKLKKVGLFNTKNSQLYELQDQKDIVVDLIKKSVNDVNKALYMLDLFSKRYDCSKTINIKLKSAINTIINDNKLFPGKDKAQSYVLICSYLIYLESLKLITFDMILESIIIF